MQSLDQTKNKKCKLQQQNLNEAYKWFSNIDIFTMNISKKSFLEMLTFLHKSSGVYLIPLTKNEQLYENNYYINNSVKIKSISLFNASKNKEIAKYTDTRIGIISSMSKIYLKIKDESVFSDFFTFFKSNNKNDKIQIKVKLNNEMEQFVVMEIVYFNEKMIKITTDPEYFVNCEKDSFLDKFPKEAFLANYKTQHFFTIEMFSKICTLNLAPVKDNNLYTFTIKETPPFFLLSKRFQLEFKLTFEDLPNCSIVFKVYREGTITTKTPYPLNHSIDIVFKKAHSTLNGFLNLASVIPKNRSDRLDNLASHRFNFKDLTSSIIENRNTFKIFEKCRKPIYVNRFKYHASRIIQRECMYWIKGKILIYFKNYNKTDKANKLILDTENIKLDKERIEILCNIQQYYLFENEACKELLYKIEKYFDGIIFFKILEPKLEEMYFILYFNFNKICILSTNDIKNIPFQWRQVIEEYEPQL